MKEFTLKFTVGNSNATLKSNDKTVIDIDVENGLDLKLYFTSEKYAFTERPLTLHADAKCGDAVKLAVGAAHIVLYVNGQLADEEWQCGEMSTDELSCDTLDFELCDGVDEFKLPIRRGLTAEELRLPGVNIGDCMPFSDANYDGRYHLFWLYDRHHHKSKWGLGAHQWAHASTSDLVHWDEHPMAVGIDEQYEGSICTGSTILDHGTYYAWYAIRMSDGSPARMTHSYSSDGDNYVKSGEFFTLPERYHQSSARDPKVVFHDGKYHMLVTTTLLSTGNGCLAHLVSDSADMRDFADLGPIIEWANGSQPECPDYFEMGGYYYLVWSIGGVGHYAFSHSPFGVDGWTIPDANTLDCGRVPKSAVCPWNGERVFAGFVTDTPYGGYLVMKKSAALDDGRLVLS